MEFRKEKSEKSKSLIEKQFQSDIFNIKTGYYKTENILPVTQKPNESRGKNTEFIPKYNELKYYEKNFINLLSDEQKHNSNLLKLKPSHSQKNFELEIVRNRSKKIKNNCYDQNGHFSAKKLYLLDVFGKANTNICHEYKNKDNSQSIKEKRNKIHNCNYNKKNIIQKYPKFLSLDIINNINENHKINNTYNKYYNNISCTNYNSENSKELNKCSSPDINRNNVNIINWTINPYYNNKLENNKNLGNRQFNKNNSLKQTLKNIKSEKIFYGHPKELVKVFSTESNQGKKYNIKRINKINYEDQEYFNILLKNIQSDKTSFLLDEKKIKEIFYKNGLHIYDFNGDGMNGLFIHKKIEAKLRKDKDDINFDRNYKRVVKELNKCNIRLDKREMIDGKRFKYLNNIKKRKGTPGTALYKNRKNKEEINKLNICFISK